MQLILASKSPRRQQLLAGLGLDFAVHPAELDESALTADTPRRLVRLLSLEKARLVATSHPEALVIGSDTVVELAGDILGKPRDADEARDMLSRLSGNTHTVHTGIALVGQGREVADVVSTEVTFRPLLPEEIQRYIASGEPFDKAGAYGIQGRAATMVRHIEGDYFAVMGLPLCRLAELLRQEYGVEVL